MVEQVYEDYCQDILFLQADQYEYEKRELEAEIEHIQILEHDNTREVH